MEQSSTSEATTEPVVHVVLKCHDYGEHYAVKVFKTKEKADAFADFLRTRKPPYRDKTLDTDPEPERWLAQPDPSLSDPWIPNPAHQEWVVRNPYHEAYGYDSYEVETVPFESD